MKDFLLQLHAQGLGHEAVIEIMVALLGVMLTVFGILIAVFGFFGYSAIRDEAIKRAKQQAKKEAARVAQELFQDFMARNRAAEYSTSQPSGLHGGIVSSISAAAAQNSGKTKASSDADLRQEDTQ